LEVFISSILAQSVDWVWRAIFGPKYHLTVEIQITEKVAYLIVFLNKTSLKFKLINTLYREINPKRQHFASLAGPKLRLYSSASTAPQVPIVRGFLRRIEIQECTNLAKPRKSISETPVCKSCQISTSGSEIFIKSRCSKLYKSGVISNYY
jgi:hypothetical protein